MVVFGVPIQIIVPDIFLLETSLWPSFRAAMVLQVCYLWHCGAQTLCICTLPSLTTPWILLTLCASVQEVCCVCSVFQGCSGSCSVEVLVVQMVVVNWFIPAY